LFLHYQLYKNRVLLPRRWNKTIKEEEAKANDNENGEEEIMHEQAMSVMQTLTIATLTFPIGFVVQIISILSLPIEIVKATVREIFSSSRKSYDGRVYVTDLFWNIVSGEITNVRKISRKNRMSKDEHESIQYITEKHKEVIKALKFQLEESEDRFRAAVQKIREGEIQRNNLNKKLQECASKLAKASKSDVRVGGTKTHAWAQETNGSETFFKELVGTGCVLLYCVYWFQDVTVKDKFDQKLSSFWIFVFWATCGIVKSTTLNWFGTGLNLIFTGYFYALCFHTSLLEVVR
jgi:hypothetical protein